MGYRRSLHIRTSINTVRVPVILQFRNAIHLVSVSVLLADRPILQGFEVSGRQVRSVGPIIVCGLHPGLVMEIAESQ